MNNPTDGTFSRGDLINGKYSVQFCIKVGPHSETYRVKDISGSILFLKLFKPAFLPPAHRTTDGDVKEIVFLKEIRHPNIVKFRDCGEVSVSKQLFPYMVLDFVSGESLAEKLRREYAISGHEVEMITKDVLHGLSYLHTHRPPIIHNCINNQSIMLDMSDNGMSAKIIDFGYARITQNVTKVYYREGLDPHYLAPECFQNEFSPQSDIFSVGVLMYHLLFGIPPWHTDKITSDVNRIEYEETVLRNREKGIKIPGIEVSIEEDPIKLSLLPIIQKALSSDSRERYQSATGMLEDLNSKTESRIDVKIFHNEINSKTGIVAKNIKQGNGFDDIAGMDSLKELLYHDVIRAIKERDLYTEYGLTIPNGLLLYGPPGCGKSFIASKFAEEVGFNFIEVKPSDLGSIYIHGSQEKISKLFNEAREKAPSIINFEEFDGLVPSRDGFAGHHQSGEVNEFLAQLNNCGEDEVFVIASTNQPGIIDPAILRSGRIDKKIYVPPPDIAARKAIFQLLLKNRPMDVEIDYDYLAKNTENYVAADIKHIINEAARLALRNKSKITDSLLKSTLDNIKPSVSFSEIQKFEQIRLDFEGANLKNRNKVIGFHH